MPVVVAAGLCTAATAALACEPASLSISLMTAASPRFTKHGPGHRDRQHKQRRDCHGRVKGQRRTEPSDIVGSEGLDVLLDIAGAFDDADLFHAAPSPAPLGQKSNLVSAWGVRGHYGPASRMDAVEATRGSDRRAVSTIRRLCRSRDGRWPTVPSSQVTSSPSIRISDEIK